MSRIRYKGIKQLDGTTCYSGPTCRKHGLYNKSVLSPLHDRIVTASTSLLLSKEAEELLSYFPVGNKRKGKNELGEASPELAILDKWSLEFRESLTKEELRQLIWYATSGYETINAYLRKGEVGVREHYERDVAEQLRHYSMSNLQEWVENRTRDELDWLKENLPLFDSIFEKARAFHDKPQVLYRAARVRVGADGNGFTTEKDKKDWIAKNFPIGKTFVNKAFTSTSLDPDYMLGFAHHNAEQVVVQEIISKSKGVPLHEPSKILRSGSIQSAEREVLLPKNTKLQVVGVKEVMFESSYPQGHPPYYSSYKDSPKRKKFLVIQLVEVN